jgi:hypothetical protein
MLPLDVQAEMIWSLQEEKRQQYLAMRERERTAAALRPSIRMRLLRASGDALIATGRSLQNMSGVAQPADYERGQLGEVA